MGKNLEGDWAVLGLSLQDKVQKDQLTHIVYEETVVMDMRDKWFTPSFLLRGAP